MYSILLGISGNVCRDRCLAGQSQVLKVDDSLGVQEVTKLLGVWPNTVGNWGREDKLPEFRHPVNNYCLYRRRDMGQMLNALRIPKKNSVIRDNTLDAFMPVQRIGVHVG